MDERKTIFGYLAEVLIVFGFTMLVLNTFCVIFGESAKEFSTMFALGGKGIAINTTLQFLGLSALIVCLRFLCFTDVLIKKMPVWCRTVCMIGAVLLVMVIFIFVCRWFPVNMWQPWAMFFACFGICFLGSLSVMVWKEKMENKRMEEALKKLKEAKKDGREV
ncbi:MAG: hypothetical protein HFH48_03470 [Lachnospiraceae bacterium]|nr:hypothetical protein [Lachnospiraceae bacterium]